jgi:hypothetical protein
VATYGQVATLAHHLLAIRRRGGSRWRPRCTYSTIWQSWRFASRRSCPANWSSRDNGRFADSPLKPCFERLAGGKGPCCSFTDGVSVQDVDWDTLDGHYRVRVYGQWLVVPDAAVVTEPNRLGPAVAWPYRDRDGTIQIRCFMPGSWHLVSVASQ